MLSSSPCVSHFASLPMSDTHPTCGLPPCVSHMWPSSAAVPLLQLIVVVVVIADGDRADGPARGGRGGSDGPASRRTRRATRPALALGRLSPPHLRPTASPRRRRARRRLHAHARNLVRGEPVATARARALAGRGRRGGWPMARPPPRACRAAALAVSMVRNGCCRALAHRAASTCVDMHMHMHMHMSCACTCTCTCTRTCSVCAVHVHMHCLYARLAPDDVAAAGAVGRVGGGGIDLVRVRVRVKVRIRARAWVRVRARARASRSGRRRRNRRQSRRPTFESRAGTSRGATGPCA